MSPNKFLIATIVVAAAIVAIAYLDPPSFLVAHEDIEVVRVGVLPDEKPEELNRRYTPLLDYLAREIGRQYRLVIPESYADLLNRFGRGELDLAYFGGFTFVTASTEYNARPLVMRDVDARFTTYFVARGDGPLGDCARLACAALAGKVMSFGSQLSTSGHLMPRHFLETERGGVEPERYFGEVRYSGTHDQTVYDVRDGVADLGAVNSVIYNAMLRDGRLARDELTVIWETPPYPDYVWATRDRLSEEFRTRLRDAFLRLEPGSVEHREILSLLRAESFLPAGSLDYEPLRQVAQSLELLAGQSQ